MCIYEPRSECTYIRLLYSDLKANLRASWNESLEEASERKILIKKTEEIQREVALANNALIMVSYHN